MIVSSERAHTRRYRPSSFHSTASRILRRSPCRHSFANSSITVHGAVTSRGRAVAIDSPRLDGEAGLFELLRDWDPDE